MKPSFRNILVSKYGLLLLAIVLFAISLLFNKLYTHRSSVARESRLLERYIVKQQHRFNSFLADTALIRRLIEKRESLEESKELKEKPYTTFLYTANALGLVQMKSWSDQQALPPLDIFAKEDGEYVEKLSNGEYLIVKETTSLPGIEDSILAFALIPVHRKFFIQTAYLIPQFPYSKVAEQRVAISDTVTDFPVHSITGKKILYLKKKISNAVPYNNMLTIILRIAGMLLVLLFIHLFAESVSKKKGPWQGVGVLAGLLLLVRLFIYFYPSFLNLRQFELFDPGIYGSNAVQRSLGDLLINALLFCWLAFFARLKLQQPQAMLSDVSLPVARAVRVGALLLLTVSTFVFATVIRSIVANSKISFDVTDFFSLDIYTVFGFVVLAAIALSYLYFSQVLFRLIFPLFGDQMILAYFAIGFTGLIYLTLRSAQHADFYIPVLCWLLFYTWVVSRQSQFFERFRINIASMLSWIFIFSVSISAIMLSENKKTEMSRRKNFAVKMADQTDPSSERLLNIALQYLDDDFLSENYSRFVDPEKSRRIRDSILTENYRGYLNKYDTRLYVYDSANQPVNNDDNAAFDDLNTMLEVQARPTRTPGLYYYEMSFDKFIFITKREIRDTAGARIGSFFILSNPKRFSSDALFPELFRPYGQTDPESSPIYSYAIYDNKLLRSTSTKYSFPISLTDDEVPKLEFEERTNGDYAELWHRVSKEKVIVMARKKDTIIETITLFSYIFCSFLFLVVFVQFLTVAVKTITNRERLKKFWQWNIRGQVHGTIIFISFLSFVIIGISTISFFISRYSRNNNDKLSRTAKIMVDEMQNELSDHSTFDDVVKIYDTVSNYNLQKMVDDVSMIHGVAVNVYDLDGSLYLSSRADIYSKGVLSKKMDPVAYYHLNRLRHVQFSQTEKIGNLSFQSIYSPVRDAEGKPYAYVNIPYFYTESELNTEISNFLVTLINLNAFIFLIAGLIALLIANRITRSFSLISEKMREVNLGKLNEEIAWSRDDEIGDLVKEYNKMVTKLGESAESLAKSEREGAWREMARQVAHEIKNPLTPMKLSIQYLQKAIDNNQPNVKELSANVANTLVEQIDHLSKIAADFSQFANIGNTNVTRFDLHDVLSSLKDLYSTDEKVEMTWLPVDQPLMLEADKTQMNRLFTNLLANAVEACAGNNFCRIEMKEVLVGDKVQVSITDNGEGIPPEMQSRIFVPNFTTKSSGTGLGLAMCKGIVEQAQGRIWFETGIGQGTTFYVELPLSG